MWFAFVLFPGSWRGVNLRLKVVTCVPGRTQQRFAIRSVLLPSDVPGPEEVMSGNINLYC